MFDYGLIGEGALHILAAAQHKLMAKGHRLVPAGATVYCQAIQMRVEEVMGLDMQTHNRYRWRRDYEGLELTQCRELWRPLTDVQEVFTLGIGRRATLCAATINNLLLATVSALPGVQF